MHAAHSVCSPPHPNSGLPEFGILSGRSQVNPTSAGEGLGVGVDQLRRGSSVTAGPPPRPPTLRYGGGRPPPRGRGGPRAPPRFSSPRTLKKLRPTPRPAP